MAPRLDLPTVTLCAVTSTNVDATVAALDASTDKIRFGDVALLTDLVSVGSLGEGRVVKIRPLRSAADYSQFVLSELGQHIRTDHCLLIQWDGFVLDAGCWDDRFLEFDYIGARWPQFDDGHDIGNGGFSLRSRKLLDACRDPRFVAGHPEDVAIGRVNRDFLERQHGIVFADRDIAARFAFEREEPTQATFGFHGVFNMIRLLGVAGFWALYGTLDERSSVFRDYRLMMRQMRSQKAGAKLPLALTLDLARFWAKGRGR